MSIQLNYLWSHACWEHGRQLVWATVWLSSLITAIISSVTFVWKLFKILIFKNTLYYSIINILMYQNQTKGFHDYFEKRILTQYINFNFIYLLLNLRKIYWIFFTIIFQFILYNSADIYFFPLNRPSMDQHLDYLWCPGKPQNHFRFRSKGKSYHSFVRSIWVTSNNRSSLGREVGNEIIHEYVISFIWLCVNRTRLLICVRFHLSTPQLIHRW